MNNSRIHYHRAKRLLDLFLAIPLLIVLLPVLVCDLIRSMFPSELLVPAILVGGRGRLYRSFTSHRDMVRRVLRLWDVVCGRVSFIGPRILPLGELDAAAMELRRNTAPGLICLHWLRWRSNVAFCPEAVSDAEYANQASLKLDISIFLRGVLVLIYGRSGCVADRNISILGVHIDNLAMPEALQSIESVLDDETHPAQIAFVNADCLNRATGDAEYREALSTTSLVLADGIGIKIAGTLLSRPIRQNVNGTDLFPLLCKRLDDRTARLFLLGAGREVVTALAKRIEQLYPNIVICGTQDGYFTDEAEVVQTIAAASPDVLLVALGAPAQETFIARNRHQLGAKICIGVGGLFDFYSGRIPRAPQWMREAGLEWVYRLYQEPRRLWQRYLLGNCIFLLRVLAEKCGVSYNDATTAVSR